MTLLTWCECGDDMHVNDGRECIFCGDEFCLRCIEEHEKYCNQREEEQ